MTGTLLKRNADALNLDTTQQTASTGTVAASTTTSPPTKKRKASTTSTTSSRSSKSSKSKNSSPNLNGMNHKKSLQLKSPKHNNDTITNTDNMKEKEEKDQRKGSTVVPIPIFKEDKTANLEQEVSEKLIKKNSDFKKELQEYSTSVVSVEYS